MRCASRSQATTEECFYALKAASGSSVVLTKLFSSQQLTPPFWAEWNGRFNASLAWGQAPAMAPAGLSFFVDANMTLTPQADGHAGEVARQLAAAKVARAEVESAVAGLRRIAYGSDAPDADVDPRLVPLLDSTAFAQVTSAPLMQRLHATLAEKVASYRDLRGMHLWLERVASKM